MESFYPRPPKPYSPYAAISSRPRRSRGAGTGSDIGRKGLGPATSSDVDGEIARIARQLAVVSREIPWERIQNDEWDRRCQYIFDVRTAARVRTRSRQIATQHGFDQTAFVNYALRRWYCFWGARIAESLFVSHPGVVPGPPKDHKVDFTIDGIPFDLKTSDVPRAFANRIGDVHTQPEQLATWFYAHQSRERRFHTANRLFLVLCDSERPDEAWRLRGDVAALRSAIATFMSRPKFVDIWVADEKGARQKVVTGVIPVLRPPGPRQLELAFPTVTTTERPSQHVVDEEPNSYQLFLPLA